MRDRKLTHLVAGALAFMLLCFCGNVVYSYRTAHQRAKEDAINDAHLKVERAHDIIDGYLSKIEVLGMHVSSNDSILPPDEMRCVFERYLEQNPFVQGFCLALEPGVMPEYNGNILLVERHDDGLISLNVLEVNPSAYEDDWYAETKRQDKLRWGNVMRDANGPLITCLCAPLHAGGRFIGVMTASLRLDTFTDMLTERISLYEYSRLYIVDRNKRYLVHPNHDYILNETLWSAMVKRGLRVVENTDSAALTGLVTLEDKEGERSIVYFAPIEKAEWQLAIENSEAEIYAGSRRLGRAMALAGLLFMVLFLLGCLFIYRRVVVVIRERSGIETELNTARRIQMAMVPKIFPAYPDRKEMDVHATLLPAKAVGGDLYDFYLVDDQLMFCIGDVSGKGVPASLFMAITRSLFRNIAYHVQSPAEIARTLNNAIAENNEQSMFVTMVIGACDLRTGDFRVCNCGHNAPVTNADVIDPVTMTVGPGDSMRFMSHAPTNIPIGVLQDYPYEEVRMHLTKGVSLYLYTDGVTEAENVNHDLYGEGRLLQVCQAIAKDATAKDVVERISSSVAAFAKGQEQSDDITLLCFQYLVDPEPQG